MLKRLLISCVFLPLIVACHHLQRATPDLLSQPVQAQALRSFHQVQVVGNLNVILRTNSNNPGVKLSGDPRDLARVTYTIRNNTLYVQLCKGYANLAPIMVEINARYLTAFSYQGNGTINGMNLTTNAMDLQINNSGSTMLNGKIGLRRLVATGNGKIKIQGVYTKFLNVKLAGNVHLIIKGKVNVASCEMKDNSWLSVFWVKSHYLKIRNYGLSFVQLAGVADTVDVELWDKARFHGQYLRAQRSFVKTHNNSQAEVSSVYSQHTLAKDFSNIYFYNLPLMKANFMAEDGSVLDFREWDRPFYQEPTPYNL